MSRTTSRVGRGTRDEWTGQERRRRTWHPTLQPRKHCYYGNNLQIHFYYSNNLQIHCYYRNNLQIQCYYGNSPQIRYTKPRKRAMFFE